MHGSSSLHAWTRIHFYVGQMWEAGAIRSQTMGLIAVLGCLSGIDVQSVFSHIIFGMAVDLYKTELASFVW